MFPGLFEQLRVRDEKGLRRKRLILSGPQEAHVTVAGRKYLAFCSNDYLGLANHPELIQSACDGAHQYGVGASASHLINGHTAAHHELEQALASFTGFPNALLFSTGYMANIGILTALLGRQDAVFADKLNHASLNDAALLCGAKFFRYPHLDLIKLEQRLAASHARRKLVVTDAVFSMDGDIAPVSRLIALCKKYQAMLLLDDAHGFGVLGKQGKGVLFSSDAGNLHAPNIIYMATLGKSAGVSGAFVAAQANVIETFIQYARSYIYTTAAPALLSHALRKSLTLIEQESWRRDKLQQNIASLKKGLKSLRWQLLPSQTPIQPLIVEENNKAIWLSDALRKRGILVPAIRPPTVPPGLARLRISLSTSHSSTDIDRLATTLWELSQYS
ncbi:MAG: 8-amino-7-oxononanoate synthase [Nitrosomonas sp.]|jgi:8-amino-7-oxononanoate synthase|nr:MAG: 8-amino-7-oxononanoate synthase [Nitrosomonas sp.]